MNAVTRTATWFLLNGGLATLAWFAVHGNEGAGRVVGFFYWFFAILMMLGALNKETRATVAAKGRSVPQWLSSLTDFALIGFLVWHGWINVGVAVLLTYIATSITFSPSNEKPATTTSSTPH